jgi:hypothetical protein
MAKTWLGTTDPYARAKRIESLDLDEDYLEITRLVYADFQSVAGLQGIHSFLMNASSPRISRVLTASGELEERVAKRIVDTTLLASTVMAEGLGPGPGRQAARRVNAMHRQYDIADEDFVMVGGDEALTTIRLAERYGWRPMTEKEKEAVLRYYDDQARAFGSHRSLPGSVAELRRFWDDYIDREARYEPQNERIARSIIGYFATLLPRRGRSLLLSTILATVDPRVLGACGLRVAPAPARWLADVVVKRIGRRDPLPDSPRNGLDDMARTVYPDGYEIARLGTHLDVERTGPSTENP